MAVGERRETERRELAGEAAGRRRAHARGAVERFAAPGRRSGPTTSLPTLSSSRRPSRPTRRSIRPHVVLLERNGEPEAVAVARVEQLDVPHKLGYRTIWRARFRAICVVQGGLLGRVRRGSVPARARRASARARRRRGRRRPVSLPPARLAAVPAGASKKPPFLCRQHVADSGIRWELELPDSLDEFLQSLSRKTRQNSSRMPERAGARLRRFARGADLRDAAEIDTFFAAVEAIAAKTYQRALGVGFGDTPAHRARTLTAMERGWFRGVRPLPRRRARGVLAGRALRRSVPVRGTPGIDPKYARYRIGTYLLLRMIDDLCRDPSVQFVDFGVGDADVQAALRDTIGREGTSSCSRRRSAASG